MIKKFCAIFLLLSSALLVTIFIAEVIKDKSNQIDIISEFYSVEGESLPNGYYKVEGAINTKSVSINDCNLPYSKKANYSPERYSVSCPDDYDLLLIEGDIVPEGSAIASNGHEEILVPYKSRFLKLEDNIIYLERIDCYEISFDIDYDNRMSSSEYKFYIVSNQKIYDLVVKDFYFDEAARAYTFMLLWESPEDYLLFGDEIEIIMSMKNENVFLIDEDYVFFDEEGAYVKKYFKTALFGAVYTKKRVTVIDKIHYYYLLEGDILNDTLFANIETKYSI